LGAATTVSDWLSLLPAPSSVELTVPVLFWSTPGVLDVTFAASVQLSPVVPAAASVPPVRLIVEEPASAVNVPPQLPVSPLGLATVRPVGSESVNDTPVSDVPESVLVIVNVSVLVPPLGIELGVNALAIVGGVPAIALAGKASATSANDTPSSPLSLTS
jgi:hypothetical protein